jgi:hypothetical protein
MAGPRLFVVQNPTVDASDHEDADHDRRGGNALFVIIDETLSRARRRSASSASGII